MRPPRRTLRQHQRHRRLLEVAELARLARVQRAAHHHVRAHAALAQRLLPPRGHDQQPGLARRPQRRRILRGEISRIAAGQFIPWQGIREQRVQRLSQHEDGPLAVRRDHHHVARVRTLAARGVDRGAALRQEGRDLRRRLVVAQRGEEQDLRRRARQLRESDAAAAAGKDALILQVRDLARARNRRDPPERDMLDVTDDRDPHSISSSTSPNANADSAMARSSRG
jgi:hypothetical protein